MNDHRDAEQRRRRREALRRHHPDLGGDAEEFVRALRSFDSGIGHPGARPVRDQLYFVRRPRGLARLAAWSMAFLHRRRRPRRVV